MRYGTLPRPLHQAIATFSRVLALQWIVAAILSILAVTPAMAETQTPAQTPFLFALTPLSSTQEGVITMLRNPNSGVLTLLPAPAALFKDSCLPQLMDRQGTFLYGTCGNGLAMYSFDSTSGAVREIPSSPYAASTVDAPFLLATESTGQYVYVLKFSNPNPAGVLSFVLDAFQIDRLTPALVPISAQALSFEGNVLQTSVAAADPNGHGIAIAAIQTDQITFETTPTVCLISFDPVTGLAAIPTNCTAVPGTTPTAFKLSPQGKYLAIGTTTNASGSVPVSYATVLIMSQNTFQILGSANTIANPPNGQETAEPLSLEFDPLGGLLYVQYANSPPASGGPSPFEIYQVPTLTHIGTLPFGQAATTLAGAVDPDGPFVYETVTGTPPQGIAVFVIDPATGLAQQPPALLSPFFPTLNLDPVFANYASAGSGQNLSGPFLSQSATGLTFGPTVAGQSSFPQTVALKSVGEQNATLTSIVLTGANATDFALSGNCLTTPLLFPQASCMLSIVYSPAATGNGAATITISGNSPGSPQMISLTGTAIVAPPPTSTAVITPASPLNISGTITEGTSSSPQNITVSNTGNAPLHVTGFVLTGLNAGDYSVGTSTCNVAVAVSSSCIIPVTFSSLASGIRSATLAITDDAVGSPQKININGTAGPAASINTPNPTTVSAGQTALFNLTATPGMGFSGTLIFTCSGAPFGATCSVPTSLAVANGVAVPFTVSVATSGPASAAVPVAPPSSPTAPLGRSPIIVIAPLVALLAILLASRTKNSPQQALRSAVSGLLLIVLVSSGVGCNSGGSTQSPPPPAQEQSTATPSIAPNGGTFSSSYPTVTMTDATPGATIHYTTDGSMPTSASTIYSASFTLNSAATVQAMATATNYLPSHVAVPPSNYKPRPEVTPSPSHQLRWLTDLQSSCN